MAYDSDLAHRVREALADQPNLREKKMFGGLAFMVDEKMVASVGTGGGALLVRVAADRDADYLTASGARRAYMGKGRSMGEGWVTVDGGALATGEDLQFWIAAVLEYHALAATKSSNKPG